MTVAEPTEDLVSTVEQWDNPLRWRVPSSTRPRHSYIVDLSDYGGNGRCLCKDFTIRHEPEIKTGAPASNAHRCKHIKKARVRFCDLMVFAMKQDQLEAVP